MAFKTATEVKVGIFVFIALVVLGVMSVRVDKKGFFVREKVYDLYVFFDSVTGLKQGAPVELAGIEIGRVEAIELVDSKARLHLAIREGIRLGRDSVVAIATRGVLGDKYVEVYPGTGQYGQLGEGDIIVRTDRSADLELLFRKVSQIADDLGVVAHSVANVLGGEQGQRDMRLIVESLRDMSVSLNEVVQQNMDNMNAILANLRDFSGDMKDISGRNKQGIDQIVDNFAVASKSLNQSLDRMNTILAKIDKGDGTMGRLVNDEEMAYDLKQTIASLESVANKIDEGKGTLGKLVNDDTTADEMNKALEGINKFLEKQETFRTSVEFSPEYHDTGDIKTFVNLKIQPSEDKYYLLGVVSDPEGYRTEKETVTYTTVDGTTTKTTEKEEKNEFDKITFNAQIAKRWGDFVLRGGLFQSTGGVAGEYWFWDDRAQLYTEVFDFGRDEGARFKSGGKLFFMKNFFVNAGIDDWTEDSHFFAGAGLHFTDDDLKFLMSGGGAAAATAVAGD